MRISERHFELKLIQTCRQNFREFLCESCFSFITLVLYYFITLDTVSGRRITSPSLLFYLLFIILLVIILHYLISLPFVLYYFITLDIGPGRPSSLRLSDAKVCAPC